MIEIEEIKRPNHTFNEHRVCVDCNSITIHNNKNFVVINTAMKNKRWYYSIDYSIGHNALFCPCVPNGDGYDTENEAICKAILKIYNKTYIPNKYKQVFREIYNKYSINNLL